MSDGSKIGEDRAMSAEDTASGGAPIDHARRLAQFAERFQSLRITSTAAAIIDIPDIMYNVKDSTGDPKIDGLKWKQLLITISARSTGCTITEACYADTPKADSGSSHAQFSVGGHVTTDPSGKVKKGGVCYLMPLCSWHNSTARDGAPFAHKHRCMVELSGYMQAEPVETFLARLDGAAPAAIVYAGEDGLESHPLADPERGTAKALEFARVGEGGLPESFVILHRVEEDGETFYRIADSRTAN